MARPSFPPSVAGNTEAALDLLSCIIENVGESIFLSDVHGVLYYINPKAESLFGYSLEDYGGRSALEILVRGWEQGADAPEDDSGVRWGADQPDPSGNRENVFLKKDGTPVFTSWLNVPLMVEGRLGAHVLIVRDFPQRPNFEQESNNERHITERTLTEQRNERLTSIVKSSEDAIIGQTFECVITDWNPGAAALFGHSEKEALGKTIWLIIPPEKADEERFIINRVRQGERIEHFETLRMRADGSRVEVSISKSPILDPSGKVVGISTIARDVTARKQVERALQASEEKLRLAVDGAGLGTWHWDLRTNTVELSEEWRRMFGIPSSAPLTYEDCLGLVMLPDRVRVEAAVQNSLSERSDLDVEFRAKSPEGADRWLSIRGRVYCDDSGSPLRLEGVLIDLSSRKLAELELSRSREWQAFALESARIGAWDWNLETGESRWNRTQKDIYGFAHGEFDQKYDTFAKRIHPDDLVVLERKIQEAIARNEPYHNEYRLVLPSGEIRWVLAWGKLSDSDVGGRRMYGVVLDITDRKRAESLLAERAKQIRDVTRRLLEVQETERRHIARELHDEIGQALTALKVDLQIVLQSPRDAEDRIEDCLTIVDMALGQVRGMALDLRPSLLDDLGLVPALEWFVARHAQRTGLVGTFRFVGDEFRASSEIETACFRAVQEALTNVARHARASSFDVLLMRNDDGLELEISDNGVGFDPKTAAELSTKGESLGLAGMRERVELAGGSVRIESSSRGGAKIVVNFPVLQLFAPSDVSEPHL